MSVHDPFDGIYDDVPSHVESAPPAAEVSQPESYSRSQLERMKKSQLQAVARERSLDTTGDRDDLIERIVADQS